MTRFFNITLLVCLAAIYYVQNLRTTPSEPEVPVVESLASTKTPQALSKPDVTAENPAENPAVKAMVQNNAPEKTTPAMEVDPAPAEPQKTLVVMAPKLVAKPQTTPVTAPLELTAAQLHARFAALNGAGDAALDGAASTSGSQTPSLDETPVLQPPHKIWRVTGQLVNARAAPSTESAILDKLVRGTIVESTGETDGPWSRVVVQDSGAVVWMHRNFLADQS